MALTAEKSGKNLNNYLTGGQYNFESSDKVTYYNLPVAGARGILIVIEGNTNGWGTRQIFVMKSVMNIYMRRKEMEAWGKWTTLDTATEFYSMMHPAGSVVLAFENMANKVEYALNAYDKKYGGGDGKSWVILDGPVINAEDCTTPIKIIEKFK